MRRLTLDANVAAKWFLADASDEPHLDAAAALLAQVESGDINLVQPPHWLVEVLGVLVRRRPVQADGAIDRLRALSITTRDDVSVYHHAAEIARATATHPLDTLYHAVALCEVGGEFITADQRYHARTRHLGGIRLLGSEFPMVHEPSRTYLIPRRSRRPARTPRAARRA